MVDKKDLDRKSELILTALRDGEKTASQICNETGIENRGSVHYRIQNKLDEYVIEADRETQSGAAEDAVYWTLSNKGFDYINEFEQELALPQTIDEVRELANTASNDAKSAKQSVQRYRQKVHQLKERVESLKSALNLESWDEVDTTKVATERDLNTIESYIEGEISRSKDDLDEVETELELIKETTAETQEIKEIQDEQELLKNSLKQVEDLEQRVEKIENKQSKLEQRVEKIENRTLRDFLPF